MRALLIILAVTSCTAVQTTNTKADFSEFAQATNQKDTLYLVNNEPVSHIIKKVWDSEQIPHKPQIIFVDSSEMTLIKKRLNHGKKI
jgi:hypothetical protein